MMGICVMAARQTLTLLVGVQILHPQPQKKTDKCSIYAALPAFFVSACPPALLYPPSQQFELVFVKLQNPVVP